MKQQKKIGITEVPCIVADDLTEKQIKAFRIADNKVSDYSIWDNKKLLEELEDLEWNIFTGFEISEIFCDELDEKDKTVLEENEQGVTYVLTIKSQDKETIENIEEFLKEIDFNG